MFCCTKSKPKKKGTENYYISLSPIKRSSLSDIRVASDCSPNTNALSPHFNTATQFRHSQSFKSQSKKNKIYDEFHTEISSQIQSKNKIKKPTQNIYSHNRSRHCEIF